MTDLVLKFTETLKLKKLSDGEVPSLAYLIKDLFYSFKVFLLLSEFTNCRPMPFRAIHSPRTETESLNTCYDKVNLILGTELNIAI